MALEISMLHPVMHSFSDFLNGLLLPVSCDPSGCRLTGRSRRAGGHSPQSEPGVRTLHLSPLETSPNVFFFFSLQTFQRKRQCVPGMCPDLTRCVFSPAFPSSAVLPFLGFCSTSSSVLSAVCRRVHLLQATVIFL